MILKKLVPVVLFLLVTCNGWCQSMKGVTGIKDTSYTTASAYQNDVKYYPDIEVVKEVKNVDIKEKRDVVYLKTGDRKLLLDVFQPTVSKSKNGIAVIIIHGGGWRSGDRSQHYPMAQKLAGLGYICFTPEYRLSTEALFPAAIYDLKEAIRWVRSKARELGFDSNKIAVAGFSAGGELSAFLGVTQNMPLFEGSANLAKVSTSVNAIIDMDGTLSFVHPESGEGDDSKGTSAATYWFGYAKKENPMLWEVASPLGYASSNTPPTLFINSSVDRMHAGRDDFRKVLFLNDVYSEVVSFDDAPHSFVLYHPWFEPTIKAMDGFLSKVFE
ncbi:alpha/beta hydrolase [Euzebyella saccharophila]|uniref:Alpha/beta hydrolase fold domain-containing protein n=1 Tax=Euzebyella saccharophila TaxID=679664 RepID=A0ABV8JSP0_9FLAO|nr:alpha/beta hydrolase [Euzebyella saccharophila]